MLTRKEVGPLSPSVPIKAGFKLDIIHIFNGLNPADGGSKPANLNLAARCRSQTLCWKLD